MRGRAWAPWECFAGDVAHGVRSGDTYHVAVSTFSPNTVVESSAASRQAWPSILLDRSPVTIGRVETNTTALQHASISRNHIKLEQVGADWELEDLDSRFGTFVNGARVKKVVLKVGDTVRIGSSPPYRFNGKALEVSLDGSGMTISLRGVGVERDGRKLIDNINLTLEADTFVGVLGPSGAGKSLMLGTLSSTMIPTSGSIEFDDGMRVNDNLDYYRSRIGIVTQDDIVHSDLTVFENVDFAAQIRLPDATPEDRAKRVDFAMEAVGLLEHREKRVGVLSGGQRKRVSVAIELILQPRLLLLDEPTSGLDPGMQARLMEMLRGLSRRGVTVVCTTHTLDTLNFFDRLLVLGLKDRIASVAYFGSPRELLPSFGVYTQMDLFDKLQTLSAQTPADRAAAEVAAEDAIATRRRPRPEIRTAKAPTGKETMFEQARVVFQRAYLGLQRDRMAVFMALLQPPILAILTILASVNQYKSIAITFFLTVCAIWLGMTLTVREVVRERKLYIRDRLAGMNPLAYLLGKLAYAGAIVIVQGTILWVIVKILGSMLLRTGSADNPGPATAIGHMNFLFGWLIVIITGFSAAMLGLLVSIVSKSERSAVGLLPLILLPQVVLSRAMTGEAKKDWDDPSPYGSMLDFVRGRPIEGTSRMDEKIYEQQKRDYDIASMMMKQPAIAKRLGLEVPAEMPPTPTRPTPGPSIGRGINLLLSAPLLTRPSTATIDMLGDPHATGRDDLC